MTEFEFKFIKKYLIICIDCFVVNKYFVFLKKCIKHFRRGTYPVQTHDTLRKQEMRPLLFCEWPLNFPICGGVYYHITYNLHWGPHALPFIMCKHAEMAGI